MSSHVYEIVKTIYSTTATDASESTRISVIQSTLGQLRLANIATLDAITTHFTRLVELTSADEAYIHALAQNIAPCILRPRVESSLTMNERYSYRLVRDLFAHKEAIFGELKRASSLGHSSSGASSRPRAISTDESNRRANMEERARAIAASGSRSRASSPAAAKGAHRREKSTGGPDTRFPIQTSPTERRASGPGVRQSLEVPNVGDGTLAIDVSKANGPATNGSSADNPDDGAEIPTSAVAGGKRDSVGRGSGVRFPRKSGGVGLVRQSLLGKKDGVGDGVHTDEQRPAGVELTDRPMDD